VSLAVNPPLRLLVAFQQAYRTTTPDWIVQVPDREMWVAASACGDETYTIVTPDLEARTAFKLRTAKTRRTAMNRPLPRWARYVAGVMLVLANDGWGVPGLDVALAGEEPSGPRYDYALGMAQAALLHEIHHQPYTTRILLNIVDRVQRDYVDG
jgi:galactokinase